MLYKRLPSTQQITQTVTRFNSQKYYNKENYLAAIKLVKMFFKNSNNYQNIFIKVNFINGAFKTSIGDTMGVAINIYTKVKDLDMRLAKGDKKLISSIAKYKVKKSGDLRNNYTFATKFCHCHYPNLFPINDRYVRHSLMQFKKIKPAFYNFQKADLLNYYKFCKILDAFNSVIKPRKLSYQTLDRYLWVLGRKALTKK